MPHFLKLKLSTKQIFLIFKKLSRRKSFFNITINDTKEKKKNYIFCDLKCVFLFLNERAAKQNLDDPSM